MNAIQRNSDSLPLELESQIDDLCNHFESELNAGRKPRLHDFLTRIEDRGKDRLLEELLAVLFEVDRQIGRRSELSAMQHEFPGKSELILRAIVKSLEAASEDDRLAETSDHRPAEQRERLTGEEGRTLRIVRENIVDQRVDVIVSSDDSHLTMGGGVSSALAEKAGGAFISEATAFAPVRPGRVIITRPGRLPVRFVFHAITIGYRPDSLQLPIRDIIAELINGCFYHAETLGVRSIAFPLLGAGAAGFSRETCLDIMFRIIARKLLHGVTCVEEARIVSMETRKAALEWYARIQKRRVDGSSCCNHRGQSKNS